MDPAAFTLHDLADFPIVRLSGRGLPRGYGPQWAAEMEALLRQDTPFVLVFLDTVEDEAQEDRKLRMLWLKQHKKPLATRCRGIVSIEPDKAMRLLKRTQGAALALAFGLTLKIVPGREEAERMARSLLAGAVPADDE
ncbi:hypothetical protein [Inquilinus limosus]|uniref:hypothetical protein n=1 Tax=Inquilinus limosus TaxID=171674 RepID=UPI0003FF918B|nr:hypothetical protein [Inquilinus limosus]